MSSHLTKECIQMTAQRHPDRTVSITYRTNLEQSKAAYNEINDLWHEVGQLVFMTTSDITEAELEKLSKMKLSEDGMSWAERIRRTLYRIHMQVRDGTPETFDAYYRERKQQLLTKLQSELDE